MKLLKRIAKWLAISLVALLVGGSGHSVFY